MGATVRGKLVDKTRVQPVELRAAERFIRAQIGVTGVISAFTYITLYRKTCYIVSSTQTTKKRVNVLQWISRGGSGRFDIGVDNPWITWAFGAVAVHS